MYQEVISPDVKIKDREFVIICKKNTSNLKRLLDKVDNIKNKIIIDDEADYASPNSKVNKTDEKGEQERTMINKRVSDLIGNDGIYIGVTATPIRIDVNRTFNNENHHWVFFEPHKAYKGQERKGGREKERKEGREEGSKEKSKEGRPEGRKGGRERRR